jgi:hypothetical protein
LRNAGALTLALAASDDVTVTSAGTLTVSGTMSGSGSDLTLTGKGSEGVQLGSLAVGGALSLNAAGPVTQAAGSALKVGANSVVDAGDAAVTLAAAGNDLAGELRVAGGRISVGSDKSLTVEIDSTSDVRVQAGVGLTVKRASVQGEASDLQLESAGAITLGEITVGDGLAISAGGAVTQTAALRVAGASIIAAVDQTVTLDNAANDFGGLTKLQAKQASVRDANELRIELTAQADSRIDAAGALTLAGSLTGAGTDLTALSSAAVSVDQLVVAGALTLQSAASVSLGATTVGGDLRVAAAGELAQSGVVRVTGNSVFDAGAGTIKITQTSGTLTGGASFAGSALQISGVVALSAGPSAALENDAVRVQSPLRGSAAANDALTLSAAGGSIVFEQPIGDSADGRLEALTVNEAVNLTFERDVRLDGDLTLRASGKVVFSQALALAAGGRLIIEGADSVEFAQGLSFAGEAKTDAVSISAATGDQTEVRFAGGILQGDANRIVLTGIRSANVGVAPSQQGASVLTSLALAGQTGAELKIAPAVAGSAVTVSAQSLSVNNADDVKLEVSLDVGTLALGATLGQITQAAGTSVRVTGAATLEARDTLLTQAENQFAGQVTIRGAAATVFDRDALSVTLDTTGKVSLEAGGALAVGGQLAGAAGNLELRTPAGVSLGELQVGGAMTLTAAGAITQTGDVRVAGSSAIGGGAGGEITLDRVGNDFGATVTVTGRSAKLADRNALTVVLDLSGDQSAGAASATLMAAGTLALSGRVAGDQATLSAGSQSGELSTGSLVVDGKATLSGAGLIRLGATQVKGDLLLEGAVAQSAALRVGGVTEIRAAGRDVNLSRDDNRFDGAVRLEAATAQLVDQGALDLSLKVTGDASVSALGALRVAVKASGTNSRLSIRTGREGDAAGEVTLIDSNIAGRVDIDSAAAVGQQGALTLGGGGRVSASGAAIVLDDPNNRIGGTLSLVGGSASVAASSDLSIAFDTSGTARVRGGGSVQVSKLMAGDGDVTLDAQGDIGIGRIDASKATIRITSGGAIYDSTDGSGINIRSTGALRLSAVGGIGAFGPASLRTDVGTVEARNAASGDVVIAGANGLRLGPDGVVNGSDKGWVVLLADSGRVDPGKIEARSGRSVMLTGKTAITQKEAVALVGMMTSGGASETKASPFGEAKASGAAAPILQESTATVLSAGLKAATEGLLGSGSAIPITQLMATRGNAAPATASGRLIAESTPQTVSERPVSAVLVPVSQTPSASLSLQTTDSAARTPSSRSAAVPSTTVAPTQAPEAPPAGGQALPADGAGSPAAPPAGAPVPAGASPAPAQPVEPAQPGDPAASPEPVTPSQDGPRSDHRPAEPVDVASDAEVPRLLTGWRARLGNAYVGLSDKLTRWLDPSAGVDQRQDKEIHPAAIESDATPDSGSTEDMRSPDPVAAARSDPAGNRQEG